SALNAHLTQINNTLDDAKKHDDKLSHFLKEIKALLCWACPIGGMNRVELEFLKKALEELKNLVAHHVNGIAIQ
ncbi:MADS-box transcription factor, partial [Trifolium medium]|nr:MADS-box transcription factor [Trifolium medium]